MNNFDNAQDHEDVLDVLEMQRRFTDDFTDDDNEETEDVVALLEDTEVLFVVLS